MPSTFSTIDLSFRSIPHVIACYVIKWSRGAIFVETGPGSTIPALEAGLRGLGFAPEQVTDVLVTHIHLDHSGAAWWLAEHGVTIHVHPNGAPHLIDPSRLLSSAKRLYGDMMEELWGEVKPIPAEQVHVLAYGEEVEIGDLKLVALDTPGHANHHMAYRFGNTCFTGDVAGVRLPSHRHLRLPTPPPEFLPDKWRASLARLRAEKFAVLVPTHFGPFEDVDWHLDALERALDEVEAFMEKELPQGPTIEELRERTRAWNDAQAEASGLSAEARQAYETALPSGTSADGMKRYWEKFRGG